MGQDNCYKCEVLENPRYYPCLLDAVKGVVEAERRDIVQKQDWRLPELMAAIRESDNRFWRWFELFERSEPT